MTDVPWVFQLVQFDWNTDPSEKGLDIWELVIRKMVPIVRSEISLEIRMCSNYNPNALFV